MLPIEQRLQHIRDLARLGVVTYDFESILERHYRRWVLPGATVIDIGAHAGRHLIPLLECIGPNGTAIGFEPIPSVFENLREKLKGSGAILVNAALSDAPAGTADFVFAQGAPEESGLRQRIYQVPETVLTATTIQVRVESLDNFARDLSRLDYVKIDIEGGEIGCLTGARETIARFRPVISVEYGSPAYSVYGHTKQTLFDLARSYGYVLYDIFLNCLETLEDWLAACDTTCWDYLMVPVERKGEFDTRMLQPAPRLEALIEQNLAMEQKAATELRAKVAELQARTAFLEERDARAAELEKHNAALLRSRSWRITAPLRAISRIAKRRGSPRGP
ncbi:FkbM family methyltransferase [Variovorax sp. dw_308]|uniref:FkbM family methyltransferase n=1 Tax=Variovorax sp. dw_308 TaxID=2721546 RepID=UPI001C448E88|nr:FkbM family methyltransferase [Variovorax sp. dw_308]